MMLRSFLGVLLFLLLPAVFFAASQSVNCHAKVTPKIVSDRASRNHSAMNVERRTNAPK
jgi:hypothetical protein